MTGLSGIRTHVFQTVEYAIHSANYATQINFLSSVLYVRDVVSRLCVLVSRLLEDKKGGLGVSWIQSLGLA